ncbi:F-actin capping protein alpha subunit [Glomus cerebriforme]|uniref:F-actin-capping protein subunit alpha n=1 Tax=Glomus cerebriforme TaxID=658196 RepID=A0A397TM22_9GLOM|nr:F-actin capping protein alpha subunit [Glomus cerebriforme]
MEDLRELSTEEKLKIVTNFLLNSPPGEINDVFNDVRVLMANDPAFQTGILDALREYNTEQYITVKLPGQENEVIVSKFGQIEDDLYLDPRSHQAFRFDHMHQTATEVEPHPPDESTELLRNAVDAAITDYVTDHFQNGVSSVYSTENGTLTITIVDNKYNSPNFWNGRWRSTWLVNPESGELKGNVKVNVHYYEDGNVQLDSNKDIVVSTSTTTENLSAAVAAYVRLIGKAENEYQTALNESYIELSENTFKSLRRSLPLTRQKVDWDKILNYKIGQELANK